MTNQPLDPRDVSEPLNEGGTWLLDLIAAVDHLRRGHRHGFTVWDALEEALRWTLPDDGQDAEWDSPDPLAETLSQVLGQVDVPVAVAFQVAVRRWVDATADRYNAGHHWPHPVARRTFPPNRAT